MQNITLKKIQINYDKATSAQVFDYLRNSIVSMEVLPGQKLPETNLAQQFGISRTPVREAISKLVNLGFIEVRPQRGTFVTKLSLTKILEAQFIREALEVAIISLVTKHHTPELITKCEVVIKKQEEAAELHDSLTFLALDDELHQILADFTHFDRAANIIQHEKAHIDRVRNLSLQGVSGNFTRIIQQHKDLVEAIKSGSVEQARTHMSIHLQEIFTTLQEVQNTYPEYFEDHEFDLLVKQKQSVRI